MVSSTARANSCTIWSPSMRTAVNRPFDGRWWKNLQRLDENVVAFHGGAVCLAQIHHRIEMQMQRVHHHESVHVEDAEVIRMQSQPAVGLENRHAGHLKWNVDALVENAFL